MCRTLCAHKSWRTRQPRLSFCVTEAPPCNLLPTFSSSVLVRSRERCTPIVLLSPRRRVAFCVRDGALTLRMISCAGARMGQERGVRRSRVACACLASSGLSARCSIVPAGPLMRGANRRSLLIGQMRVSGGAFLACALNCLFLCLGHTARGAGFTRPALARWGLGAPPRNWLGSSGFASAGPRGRASRAAHRQTSPAAPRGRREHPTPGEKNTIVLC